MHLDSTFTLILKKHIKLPAHVYPENRAAQGKASIPSTEQGAGDRVGRSGAAAADCAEGPWAYLFGTPAAGVRRLSDRRLTCEYAAKSLSLWFPREMIAAGVEANEGVDIPVDPTDPLRLPSDRSCWTVHLSSEAGTGNPENEVLLS